MTDGTVAVFESVGLNKAEAAAVASNPKLSSRLLRLIEHAGCSNGAEKAVGMFLYQAATSLPAEAEAHEPLVASYVASKKIARSAQMDAAIAYFKRLGKGSFDANVFEESCGIGIDFTEEKIAELVSRFLAEHEGALRENRYLYVSRLLGGVRTTELKWADGKSVKAEIDRQVEAMIGPRTAEDEEAAKKGKKGKKGGKADASKMKSDGKGEGVKAKAAPAAATEEPKESTSELAGLLPPSANTTNEPAILEAHLKRTGGKWITRFPPEPNGYLHIGHAKAMRFNFSIAQKTGGDCLLRFDDTNPEAESMEYVDSIHDIVGWLGYKPTKVTHSSDYFQELYDLAVELIRRGKAYVCHQTAEEMRMGREKMTDSPWRNRSVEENLRLFDDMRKGKFDEGTAVLRMKGDMKHTNPNLRDTVFYRVRYTAHPIAGSAWCVYPTYDYTHCIVDSLEDITHSLCTLEFEVRRLSYFWLLEMLDLYKPVVWEYSRLNISHNVLSKRKLKKLVEDRTVRGWDDPRLLSLAAMRRRGYPAEAINAFCDALSVTRNENMVHFGYLEHFIRLDLDNKVERRFLVLDPLKITLKNVGDKVVEVEAPNHPKFPERGTRKMPLRNTVYIERSDFREKDSKDYYGLAPGKKVRLRYAYFIQCDEVVKDENGTIVELKCTADLESMGVVDKKIKGNIHWVSEDDGGKLYRCESRLYNTLFTCENPAELDDWEAGINSESEVVRPAALMEPVWGRSPGTAGTTVQCERLGYFCVDTDTSESRVVLNRTVSLKDSYGNKCVIPNCVFRSKTEKRKFVGDQVSMAKDPSALLYRRPHEAGYNADFYTQEEIWERVFDDGVLGVKPEETKLLLSEPVLNFEALQNGMDELVFEAFGFSGLSLAAGPELVAQHAARVGESRALGASAFANSTGAALVIDCGHSFCHAVPLFNGRVVTSAVKRVSMGGKALTNALKEIISYRHWNMMDETYLVNDIKEKMCHVETDFRAALLRCAEPSGKESFMNRYVLPNYTTRSAGFVMENPATYPGQTRVMPKLEDDVQILRLANERFTIPEAIFSPSVLQIEEGGIVQAVEEAVAALPEPLQGPILANVILTGGSSLFSGFADRLYADLRAVTPSIVPLRIQTLPDPVGAAWRGGNEWLQDSGAEQPAFVSREEYAESGSAHVRERFHSPSLPEFTEVNNG